MKVKRRIINQAKLGLSFANLWGTNGESVQNITALANKNAIIVQNLYSLLYERILTKKVENYVPITLTCFQIQQHHV